MGEPLAFARSTLINNLSVLVTTKDEIAERERQLTTAYDKLMQAYYYADEQHPAARMMIEIYQGIVAALMRGGGAYAKLCVQKLKSLSDSARREAETALIEADKIDPDWFERNRVELVGVPVDYSDQGYRNMAVDKNIDDAREHKIELRQKAADLNEASGRVDVLWRLIDLLAKQTADSLARSD